MFKVRYSFRSKGSLFRGACEIEVGIGPLVLMYVGFERGPLITGNEAAAVLSLGRVLRETQASDRAGSMVRCLRWKWDAVIEEAVRC